MAHDGRGDPAGTSSVPAAGSASNRGFPVRLDTSFSSAPTASEATSIPSSTSRRGSLLADQPQFRPQSLHLPSPAHHAHARAATASGRASLPRRWTTSSPRTDADLLRAGGTAATAILMRRPSALQRVASSIRRLTHTSPAPGSGAEDDENWSVFGEVMAHEGAQPPPLSPLPSSSRSPSSSRPRRSDAGDGLVPNLQVRASTPVGGELGYTSSIRQTQSPTSDAHFEDYFPLEVEEGDEEGLGGNNYHEGVSNSDAGLHPSRMRVDSADTELLSSTSSYKGSSQKDRSLSRDKEGRWRLHLPTLPTLYRNILKCSLAYLLGSLFTYYIPLAHFISELTQDSPGEKYPSVMGHMVATV